MKARTCRPSQQGPGRSNPAPAHHRKPRHAYSRWCYCHRMPEQLLAEALAERAGKQRQLKQLIPRIADAARNLEGETPPENAADLLVQARGLVREIGDLVRRINFTNSGAELYPDAGTTITDAIARRDTLSSDWKLVTEAADTASGGGRVSFSYGRSRASELKTVVNLPVEDLRRQADQIAEERRKLDVQIQQAGWRTPLAG